MALSPEGWLRVLPALLALAGMGVGLAGTLVPVLPGLPLMALVAVLYGWWEGFRAASPGWVFFWVGCALAGLGGETAARMWGARRFGASRAGAWGALVGGVVGAFFLPVGLVLGPLLGALVGEVLAGRPPGEAVRAGLGGAAGALLGTGLNFVLGVVIFSTFVYRLLVGGI